MANKTTQMDIGQIAIRFDIECSYDGKKSFKVYCREKSKGMYQDLASAVIQMTKKIRDSFFCMPQSEDRSKLAEALLREVTQRPSLLLPCCSAFCLLTGSPILLATSDFDLAEGHLVFV